MNHYEEREKLAAAFMETRRRTLLLAEAIPPDARSLRVHPGYSPFDWHLGHIGMTEWLWALQATGQVQSINPELEFIFSNIPQNPKDNRSNLPDRVTILRYLRQVRERTLDFLQRADFDSPDPLLNDGYAFRFVLAHEWQHQETLIELLHLISGAHPVTFLRRPYADAVTPYEQGAEIQIPVGTFIMGTDDSNAYDNERPAHEVTVGAFAIDELPVAVAQF
nr:DinB family protein [Armatimonadota bacterium]